MVVRTGQEPELSVFRACFVELNSHIEARTQHEVSTHSAVAVPRQIGQAFNHARILDDHAQAIEAIWTGQQLRTRKGCDCFQAIVSGKVGEYLITFSEVGHATTDFIAVRVCRPPRTLVIWGGTLPLAFDDLVHRCNLFCAEHISKNQVATSL